MFHFGEAIAYDAHSAMALIRTWDGEVGTTRTLWAMGGRRMWRADLRLVGRETIGTAMGNRPVVVMEGIAYRLQQLFILLAHLLLLKWMFYALSESGALPTLQVMLHFTGMAVYGGLLIRGTAYWARRRYIKETGNDVLP